MVSRAVIRTLASEGFRVNQRLLDHHAQFLDPAPKYDESHRRVWLAIHLAQLRQKLTKTEAVLA